MKRMVICGLLAGVAAAASADPYVGAAIGSVKYGIDCEGASSCDLRDTVLKLYAGQKVNEWVSAEAAYIRFGQFKGSGPLEVNGQTINLTEVTQRAQAMVLAAAFRREFAPGLEGVARIGAAVVYGKVGVNGVIVGGANDGASVIGTSSDTSVRPYFGLGLAYQILPGLKATLDYDRTSVSIDSEATSLQSLMAGVAYKF